MFFKSHKKTVLFDLPTPVVIHTDDFFEKFIAALCQKIELILIALELL